MIPVTRNSVIASLTKDVIAVAPTVNRVRFDARVLMSLIQNDAMSVHADEGYLFGVMVGDVLEISNCISLPPERTTTEHETDAQKEFAHRMFLEDRQKYQTTLAECFRKLNMDSEVVGWYTVAYPDGPTSKEIVETQLSSQQASPNFIMVAYDPFRSLNGKLHLRVLRLTEAYLKLKAEGDLTQQGVSAAGLVGKDIYEEIPYDVNVSLLNSVYLCETDMNRQSSAQDGNTIMAERQHSSYLKRCLGDMARSLDSLSRDLGDCTGKPMRRKGRETNEGQSRHNSLLTSRGLPAELQHAAELSAEFTQSALLGEMVANQ